MTLGELHKCWCCWELESMKYQDAGKGSYSDFKQLCTPYRSKKNTICGGAIAWLCSDCKMNMKGDNK